MVSIPDAVFAKYEEFVDSMIDTFGIACKLIYTQQTEVITPGLDYPKQQRTMAPNAIGGFVRGSTSYKDVEQTEDITLRVYWTEKDWKKIGNFDIPEGSIMCIGYLSDMSKITKAKHLLVHSEMDQELRFERSGETFPWGLKQRRYLVSTWKRA